MDNAKDNNNNNKQPPFDPEKIASYKKWAYQNPHEAHEARRQLEQQMQALNEVLGDGALQEESKEEEVVGRPASPHNPESDESTKIPRSSSSEVEGYDGETDSTRYTLSPTPAAVGDLSSDVANTNAVFSTDACTSTTEDSYA